MSDGEGEEEGTARWPRCRLRKEEEKKIKRDYIHRGGYWVISLGLRVWILGIGYGQGLSLIHI